MLPSFSFKEKKQFFGKNDQRLSNKKKDQSACEASVEPVLLGHFVFFFQKYRKITLRINNQNVVLSFSHKGT